MNKFLRIFTIICIVIATMTACSSNKKSVTDSESPSSTVSTPTAAVTGSENIQTGSMKQFYDINIYYDPNIYSVNQQNSSDYVLFMQSTDENNDFALRLYYQNSQTDNNMDIADAIISEASTNGFVVTSQAEEVEINGGKWTKFSTEYTYEGQVTAIDNYICHYNKGYYVIEFGTLKDNYDNLKEPAEQFLQKITFNDIYSSEPIKLSTEDLTVIYDWQAVQTDFYDFSFEIPNLWIKTYEDTEEHTARYAPSDDGTQLSNIVVEACRTRNIAPSYNNLAQSDIYDIVMMTVPGALNVEIGDCYQVPLGYAVKTSYQLTIDTNTVMQTQYIFLLDYYMLNIYTTDFDDNAIPILDEAVKHMIGTMILK